VLKRLIIKFISSYSSCSSRLDYQEGSISWVLLDLRNLHIYFYLYFICCLVFYFHCLICFILRNLFIYFLLFIISYTICFSCFFASLFFLHSGVRLFQFIFFYFLGCYGVLAFYLLCVHIFMVVHFFFLALSCHLPLILLFIFLFTVLSPIPLHGLLPFLCDAK
jgi:hypothetical protein